MDNNPLLVDPLTLTIGELYAIHELTDWSTSEIYNALGNGSGGEHPGLLLALALIEGRRHDPDYSLADAGAIPYVSLFTDDGDHPFAEVEDDDSGGDDAPMMDETEGEERHAES